MKSLKLFFIFFIALFLLNSCALIDIAKPEKEPAHIMLAVADHWEPGWEKPDCDKYASIWREQFPFVAKKHFDADGVNPQHTWFCSDITPDSHLKIISDCVFNDLGEMEVHIHHGKNDEDIGDTCGEMNNLIDKHMQALQQVGACISAEPVPQTHFAFVHGCWALDNSDLDSKLKCRIHCGCSNEIKLLLEKNCYADFTLPYFGGTQRHSYGAKIMAVRDCPNPKSYDIKENLYELKAGGRRPAPDELPLVMGPLFPGNITGVDPRSLDRMQKWLSENIHIPGRDNWIFVKLYTHSRQIFQQENGVSALTGELADYFYSDMERVYNDGKKYKLHYVTAREMHNIIMAAVDGKSGDPGKYRDYIVPQPVNKKVNCNRTYLLLSYNGKDKRAEIKITGKTKDENIKMSFKEFDKRCAVYEKNKENDEYVKSDAEKSSAGFINLIINDSTPSNYYLIKKE